MAVLNYHHLRYFWAVAHDGNLTRTAERLNLTQSALSVQIRKLEERLGHALFERRGRQLHLTEAGRIALDHADSIFAAGEELLGTLQQTGTARQALRIGALATLSRNFQVEFLRPLLGRNDIEIILRSGSTAELLRSLETLSLDLVLLNQPPARDALTPFVAHRLAEQPVSLVGTPKRLAMAGAAPAGQADGSTPAGGASNAAADEGIGGPEDSDGPVGRSMAGDMLDHGLEALGDQFDRVPGRVSPAGDEWPGSHPGLVNLLSTHPVILPTTESEVRTGFDALMDRLGIRPQIAAEVEDMAMLRLLAREDAGLAVLPPIVVKDEIASGTLVEADRLPGIEASFYAVTIERRFPNLLLRELLHGSR